MTEQFDLETTDDVSAAFDLLRNARRRAIIYTVRRNGRTSVSEVSRRIAAWRAADDDHEPDPATIQTSLVHTHLPKLDDVGAVDYDRENGAVEPTDAIDDLEPLLDCTRERDPDLFYAARAPSPEGVFET